MTRGRKKTPTAILEMRGSLKKNPHLANHHEPAAPKEKPACPAYLDRIGKAEWKWLIKSLDDLGVLSRVDRDSLATYCQTYSEWRKAVKQCQDEGAWYEVVDRQGNQISRRHEWDRIREQTAEAMRKWLVEFGLTPSSRSRLKVEKPITAIQDINARKR